MRRERVPTWIAIAILMGSLAATAAGNSGGDAGEETPDSTAASGADVPVFSVEIGNRLYPKWREEQRVREHEFFFLGDTRFTARVEEFLPDFRIGDDGPFSASPECLNPAIHVIVYDDTLATDSSWAFRNFPPHFSTRSFFMFKLLDVAMPGQAETSEGE